MLAKRKQSWLECILRRCGWVSRRARSCRPERSGGPPQFRGARGARERLRRCIAAFRMTARRFGCGRRPARIHLEENVKAPAGFHRADLVGDIIHMVSAHYLAALVAGGDADARKQQPKIIVDFSGRGHCRARITSGVLLADRHGRSDPHHFVNVRLLHAFQELAGIGGERLDVTTLPLGIKRVKRQTGFARAGKARHHRQPVVGYGEIDIPQIMDARSAHDNGIHFAGPGKQT